ncbi:hypothetical protein LCGC14_0938130 [marine sediment metagenome]|uniref:Uncharacterized protein n=1 Tax=marine sediment metagenome TaxID=412755 RepID=A0A0F9P701_9ZZZZ
MSGIEGMAELLDNENMVNIGIRFDKWTWASLGKHDPEYYNELREMFKEELK